MGATLITGASGFLGRHLSREWVARGVPVRGLVRPGSQPLERGVEHAPAADLADREGIRAAVRGAETVIHLAARVHVMRDTAADPLAEFRRVNVEATRVLLEEAVAAGVRRFLFVSSVKAVGEGGSERWNEETPVRPVDPYGISKLEAERLVRELADEAGVHAPILRLPLVYGPGVRANFRRLLELVDRGVPLPLGAVRNRRSLAYVGNVAAAVEAALASPAAARETFFVSDGEDLSTPDLVREIAAALGRPARLVPVPPALFRAGGAMGDVLARLGPFPLTSAAVDRLLGSLVVDSSRLVRCTGYRPPFTVSEGVRATARWYRAATAAGGGAGA